MNKRYKKKITPLYRKLQAKYSTITVVDKKHLALLDDTYSKYIRLDPTSSYLLAVVIAVLTFATIPPVYDLGYSFVESISYNVTYEISWSVFRYQHSGLIFGMIISSLAILFYSILPIIFKSMFSTLGFFRSGLH